MKTTNHDFVFEKQKPALHLLSPLRVVYITVALLTVSSNFVKPQAVAFNAIQRKQLKGCWIVKVVVKLTWIFAAHESEAINQALMVKLLKVAVNVLFVS